MLWIPLMLVYLREDSLLELLIAIIAKVATESNELVVATALNACDVEESVFLHGHYRVSVLAVIHSIRYCLCLQV